MPIRISGSTGISGLDGSASAPVYAGANTNVGLFVSGNTVNVSATNLSVGNTVVSNSGVSVGGIAVSQYSGMMKNRIINGDFRIDQRFNGAANNQISAPQYVVDRWWNSGQVAGKLRFQRNNTNGPGQAVTQNATGFPYYFGANVVSSNTVNAGDLYRLAHVIEGLNISDLGWGTANASPVTLSFWSYSSVTGIHSVSFINGDGTRSYPVTYTINTANTWQYQTITVPGDTSGTWLTDNGIGIYLFYDLGYGSNWQQSSGSWYSGNYQCANGSVKIVNNANGSFYLTGVQLEKGSTATPFEFRHYTTELQLCQRYYESSGQFYGTVNASYNNYVTWFFKVSKRAIPTISYAAGSTLTTTSLTVDSLNGYSSPGTYPLINTGTTASAELAVQN